MFKKYFNLKHKAFSLIEAMIILLLISAAVMLLIPLISSKTEAPRWKPIKNVNGVIEGITYGQNSHQRIGIGTTVDASGNITSLNPYQDTQKAKFLVSRLAHISAAGKKGMLWGENYNPTSKVYSTVPYPATSVILGMNTCSDTPKNSIILRSLASNTSACSDGKIAIGANNDITIANDILNVGKAITVDNDKVRLNLPDGSKILAYSRAGYDDKKDNRNDLSADTTYLYPDYINVANSIYLSASNMSTPDYYTCYCITRTYRQYAKPDGKGYEDEWTLIKSEKAVENNRNEGSSYSYATATNKKYNNGKKYETIAEIAHVKITKTCECKCEDGKCEKCTKGSSLFAMDGSKDDTYCKVTEAKSGTATYKTGLWQGSDIRLKNIKADYNKGLNELDKLETYLFTFKNDIKKRLHVGVIAQKLIGVFDEALSKDERGFYSYDKSSVLYAMVNAVKEINQKQIDLLKAQKKANKKADKLIRMYE